MFALSFFSKVKIGPRLIAGFLILIAASGFIGYKSIESLAQIKENQANASCNYIPTLIGLARAGGGTLEVQRAERTAILRGLDKEENGV